MVTSLANSAVWPRKPGFYLICISPLSISFCYRSQGVQDSSGRPPLKKKQPMGAKRGRKPGGGGKGKPRPKINRQDVEDIIKVTCKMEAHHTFSGLSEELIAVLPQNLR